MERLAEVAREGLRTDIPAFEPGDTVKVMVRVREGDKERLQAFEGIVIAKRGGGISENFTVRKVSAGVGVERVFPIHSPTIASLELVRRGGSRVAKTRHSVWLGDDGWVLDTFAGANAPLMVAEVERGGPVTDLTIPSFCVTEVTSDPRFSNDSLSGRPYGAWAADYEAELAAQGPRFLKNLGHNHRE